MDCKEYMKRGAGSENFIGQAVADRFLDYRLMGRKKKQCFLHSLAHLTHIVATTCMPSWGLWKGGVFCI